VRFRVFLRSRASSFCRSTLLLGFSSVVVAAASCDRSRRPRLLPTHSFARYRCRFSSAALHAGCRRVSIWCAFLTARTTPSKMLVRWTRVEHQSPHLRLHSSWPKREGSRSAMRDRIEQSWLNLGCEACTTRASLPLAENALIDATRLHDTTCIWDRSGNDRSTLEPEYGRFVLGSSIQRP